MLLVSKMWLVLLWLIGIPKVLYNFFLTSVLLMLLLGYKIFGRHTNLESPSLSRARLLRQQLERRQRLLFASGGQLKDRIKSAIMRGTTGVKCFADGSFEQGVGQAGCSSPTSESNNDNHGQGIDQTLLSHHQCISNSNSRRPPSTKTIIDEQRARFYLANLAVVYVLLVASVLPMGAHCLEQDAAILEPVANIAKSVIKTVTLGEPLELNFDPAGLVKNFAYFTWRTRFPVSMPRGFTQKAQDFYNRVKDRVDVAGVSDVQRKSLANLKLDLDNIVDSIVEEVRQSPDGLYTDYLETRVDGIPLEDACTAVGIQLKAYGVDLTNYRNIAGMVLGIPVMPTVASAVVNVASYANLETMRNLTLNPLDTSTRFLTALPNSAAHSVSLVSSSIDNLRQQVPVQNLVQAPMTLLSSGQRLFGSSSSGPATMADQARQPVFA